MTALERTVCGGSLSPSSRARVSRHGASGHTEHHAAPTGASHTLDYAALTGASVTPVNTTTFRSGLILSIFPGIYEVFLLAYAQISSVETPLVAGRHTDGNTPLDSSLSRGDQTEQPGLVDAGGLGAACHPIVCNH